MRASEFITERKKRKRRLKGAAWGPGLYGGYGYATGYSGDGGGAVGGDSGGGESINYEASYQGNLGMMELAKFFQTADSTKKELFQKLLKNGKKGLAWKLVQDTIGVKLQGKEFDVDEGWKDWVAGAAIGAAALGGAGNADAAVKKDVNKPAIQQVVKKQDVKKIAPPAASKKELAKSVTGNPHEVYLRKAAEKAGMQGQELIAFLSQCAHETLDFKHMKEIGGKLDFKKYDPRFAPRKAKILGNTNPGDGAKYKGRGYIQITGKYNYGEASKAIFGDDRLVKNPELVEKPEIAAKTSVWYWKHRVANKVDSFKDTSAVTKTINPALKHLDQRKDKQKAFQVAMR